MNSITINPQLTTVATGLFQAKSSNGLVQGTAYPNPSTRWGLRSGTLDNAETLPMWGGVGVYQDVPYGLNSNHPQPALGGQMGRALSFSDANKPLNGWSVFDQAYGMVTSPQSPVPLAAGYGQVMMYPLGSRARIALACDPALISQRGGPISKGVAWDYVNQLLIPVTGALAISSGTYVSGTGVITLTMGVNPGVSVPDTITLSALTGTGAFASLNGAFPVIAPTSGTTVTLQGPVGAGAATITGGSFTTGPALAGVTMLEVHVGTCMTVSYDSTTGFATWNTTGSCAVIQI